jgi:hypothetical protein
MYLILWEANMSLFPSDQQERVKAIMVMAERVKKDVDSGDTKLWGINVAGGNGFSVSEKSPKEVFGYLNTYTPYIKFEVRQMLTIDEMIEVMKGMQ